MHAIADEPRLARRVAQLLGLRHPRLLRAAPALRVRAARRPAGRRVQGDGRSAARGRHRGDPRRRLQPHRPRGARRPTCPGADSDNAHLLPARAHGGYVDDTGCGNTLDLRDPAVRPAGRWTRCGTGSQEMHVDGFRFDLAAGARRAATTASSRDHRFSSPCPTTRCSSRVKLIAEPWDVGPGWRSASSRPLAEWNDRYRDTVRNFWLRRHAGGRQAAAASATSHRLAGRPTSSPHDRGPFASVNFVTAHDGFTLRDLVTYDHKHNRPTARTTATAPTTTGRGTRRRGRDRRPGDRCRAPPADAQPARTLLLSTGVPMLTTGDEIGRTQRGNNNAYCQDNEIAGWTGTRRRLAARPARDHAPLLRAAPRAPGPAPGRVLRGPAGARRRRRRTWSGSPPTAPRWPRRTGSTRRGGRCGMYLHDDPRRDRAAGTVDDSWLLRPARRRASRSR